VPETALDTLERPSEQCVDVVRQHDSSVARHPREDYIIARPAEVEILNAYHVECAEDVGSSSGECRC